MRLAPAAVRPTRNPRCGARQLVQRISERKLSRQRGVVDEVGWHRHCKVEVMPHEGALWNPRVGVELRALAEVVNAARQAEPSKSAREVPERRPGWATHLVLEVLRSSGEPLKGRQIKVAVEARLGETVNKDTLRYALQFSRPARRGEIVRLEDGRYVSRSDHRTPS